MAGRICTAPAWTWSKLLTRDQAAVSIHYFGIRHHGPGSARALEQALHALQPDCVLIEGPPEADGLLAVAARSELKPPVALLVYPPEAPRMGVFYPFAEFSPEWRAIRHALEHAIPVSFIDLPQTHHFAERLAVEAGADNPTADPGGQPGATDDDDDRGPDAGDAAPTVEEGASPSDAEEPHFDPLSALSEAAGLEDEEQWWEQQVEHRRDSTDLFEAIAQAMTALREQQPAPSLREQRREAHMRLAIRKAENAGHQRIAVVCGAWHVPALAQKATVKDDQVLLKGLPKTRTEAAWIPWSNDRLAQETGYGAGVRSPGWYAHVWRGHGAPVESWMTRTAQQMREMGVDASSASVIEAVRLARTLAALRECTAPSLREINEALLTVLCHGDEAALTLVRRQTEIGDVIGSIPPDSEHVPLQRDLEVEQKRVRLKPSTEIKRLELDLRDDNGRARSHLLHRLSILGVAWGEPEKVAGKSGTFHEHWTLQWQPELQLRLIEAGRYGNTLREAAAARLVDGAATDRDLAQLTENLDRALLAQLPRAVDVLLAAVRNCAAVAADIEHLMKALAPLTRVARYGDVRGTAAAAVEPIIESLVERITVGLPLASSALDDEAAGAMLGLIADVQASLDTLENAAWLADWQACLQRITPDDSLAPPIRGYALRLLFDRKKVEEAELARLAGLMLSAVTPPLTAAAWLSGMLRGSGLLLLNQDELWRMLDGWLRGLSHEQFQTLLPMVRRAFSDFTQPERRRMNEKVRHLGGGKPRGSPAKETAIDVTRARRVLPVLRQITGVEA
jgi:hypothetical protein